MALRTDLTDSTAAIDVHADQHNEVNGAAITLQSQVGTLQSEVGTLQTQVAQLIAGGGGGSGTAPAITTQPTNQSVTPGSNATFNAHASGSPTPTVQWSVSTNGGTSFSPISGATSTTLVISSTTTGQNNNLYFAVFTNSQGTAQTNTVTLAVSASGSAPVITTQPNSQSAIAGANATFVVAATGSPTPTVQWYLSTNGGTSFNIVSGATSYTLVITSTTVGQNGNQYHAVLTNSGGSVTSNNVTLNVGAATVIPSITTQPTNHTVTAGQSVTFTAGANGTPTPTAQWQVSTDGGSTWNNVSGATSDSYVITTTIVGQNGNVYRAVYTNSAGSATTNAVTLLVNASTGAPTMTQQPVNQSVVTGNSATYTAAANGTPTPTVQWYLSTDSGSTYTPISGATSNTYTISSVASGQNNNRFYAIYTNSAGSTQSNTVSLTVVVYSLQNQQQATGGFGWSDNGTAGDGRLAVAVGTNTIGLITEIISDNNITYDKVGSFTEGDQIVEIWSHTALNSYEGSTWAANLTSGGNNGNTQVFTYRFNGSVSSPVVHNGDVSIGPFTVPQNSLVMLGAGVDTGTPSLPTGFTAGPTPTNPGTRSAWRIVAPTESETLVVNAGAALAVVYLIGAPLMSDHPSPVTVSVGNTATFSSVAVGTPVPSCQWQVSTDGGSTWANVTGASGATTFYLEIPNVTLGLSGNQYRAVFVNASGTITSNPAGLTVGAVGTGGTGTVTLVDQVDGEINQTNLVAPANFSPAVGDGIVIMLQCSNNPTPVVTKSITASNGDTFMRVGTYDPNPSAGSSVPELWFCGSSAGGSGVTYTYTGSEQAFNFGMNYWWLHFNGTLSHPYYTFGQGQVAAFTPRNNSLVVMCAAGPFQWPPPGYNVATSGNLAYLAYATSPGAINLNCQSGAIELAVCFDTT